MILKFYKVLQKGMYAKHDHICTWKSVSNWTGWVVDDAEWTIKGSLPCVLPCMSMIVSGSCQLTAMYNLTCLNKSKGQHPLYLQQFKHMHALNDK